MKKKITTLFLLALGTVAVAQDGPGIGIGNPLPSQSAMLDIAAEDKGVLIPRMALTDLTKFHLQGSGSTEATQKAAGALNEGILIYNNVAVLGTETVKAIPVGFYYWTNDGTPRWELITSQSVTEKILERITTVEKSVGVGTENEDDKKGGGTIIYRPGKDGTPGTPGEPGEGGKPGVPGTPGTPGQIVIKDGEGKDVVLDLGELLRGAETNTFFKIVDGEKVTVNGVETTKRLIYYFNEIAVSTYKASFSEEDRKKLTEEIIKRDIPNSSGIVIDITSVVSSNLQEIFNEGETKKIVEEVLKNVKGNVTIIDRNAGKEDEEGYKPVYEIHIGDDKGGNVVFDLNQLETKTRFEKRKGDGTKAEEVNVKTLPADATAKGKILYTYYGEDKDDKGVQIPSYIDITSDFLTSIKENKEIREQIVNVISNPNGGAETVDPNNPVAPGGNDKEVETPIAPKPGEDANASNKNWGNVYYGPLNPSKPELGNVLYTLDKDGNKKPIDIAANITEAITNNPTLIDKIKEVTIVKVEGTNAGEQAAGVETGEVIDGKKVMKAQFNAVTVAKGNDSLPYNSEFNATGFKVKEFGRLLSVQILDTVTKQLVMNTVTSVTFVGDALKFKFGVGNMFATLPAEKTYDVIIEYVSSNDAK